MSQTTELSKILSIFNVYLNEEIQARKIPLPYACCLSTIGLDGFPNSRFVSLKEIKDDHFVITGTISSRKGMEIQENHQVALAFWWPETQRQVRIQGIAKSLEGPALDHYFNERNLESRIVSVVSDQGKVMKDRDELLQKFDHFFLKTGEDEIQRPENWGAYVIDPIRIEFLAFSETRFHNRTLFEKMDNEWKTVKLQP